MKQKIFMVSQVSKPNSESRRYADAIFECIKYGLSGIKDFIENGIEYYSEMNTEYENCKEHINKLKIDLTNGFELERHDIHNYNSDLLQDLVERLSHDYYGYIVLIDTEKEFNNHGEPPYTNANVFFEYGVLRAQIKRIALVKQSDTKLPWDICVDNATIIPDELLELIKNYVQKENGAKRFGNIISDSDKKTKIKVFRMCSEILNKLANPSYNDTIFNSVIDRMEFRNEGFENTRQMIETITTFFEVLDVKKLLEGAPAKYINTEKEAFKALTEAVSMAKSSIRTTRFANESIVNIPNENEVSPKQKFMEALYKATVHNSKLLCYRIVCNNSPDKWWDIYQTLVNSNNNMNIFVCKQQYDIHFEIVVIDEEITFLHFYQTSEDGHVDGAMKDGTKVRKIQSTLRITDTTVSEKFAKIFDRLHHRDQNSISRRLLQIGGNLNDIENNFEGMVLKLENRMNPEADARKLLLDKWKAYKKIYDQQSPNSISNMDKQDYINFTVGLAQINSSDSKGCGMIDYDNELKEAYNEIKENNSNSKLSKEQ